MRSGFTVAALVALIGIGTAGLAPAIDCISYDGFPRLVSTHAGVAPTELAQLDAHHLVGLDGTDLLVLGGDALPDFDTVARLTVASSLAQLSLVGSLAYFTDGAGALHVADLSDPDHPTLLGTPTLPGTRWTLAGGGSLLGAVSNGTSWGLYDCSDPLAPVLLSATSTTTNLAAMVLRGQRAVIFGTGWRLYDISDPASPALLGAADYPYYGDSQEAGGTTVAAADLVGDRLVTLEDHWGVSGDPIYGTRFYLHLFNLRVSNCTDPGDPIVLLEEHIGNSQAWTNPSRGLRVNGNLAAVHGGDDPLVTIYDVGGSPPARVGAVDAASFRGGLFPTADRILVAGSGASFCFTRQATGPDNVLVTQWPNYGLDYTEGATDIAAGDGWLAVRYYAAYDRYTPEPIPGLKIYRPDLSLSPIAHVDNFWAERVAADGDRLYGVYYGELDMIDLSDPAHPGPTEALPLPLVVACIGCGPADLAAVGRRDGGGIDIYDLADAMSPVLLGNLPGVVAKDLLWRQDRLYAATASGVTAMDVTDPTVPLLLGQAPAGSCTWLRPAADVIVTGAAHLVAVLDLDASGVPSVRATATIPGTIAGVTVVGNTIYVSNGSIFALSLTDLSQRGELVPTGPLGVLATCGGEIFGYGKHNLSGLYRVPLACEEGPTLALGFQVTTQAGEVVASWRAEGPVEDFRLEGRRGDESWLLPVRRDGDRLTATEDPARCAAGGVIVYTLWGRSGDDWVVLASETVRPQAVPAALRLVGVAPNPFNPTLAVSFAVDRARPVSLAVYDLRGRRVRELAGGLWAAGPHEVRWDGKDAGGTPVASGPYVVRLAAENGRVIGTAKVTLMR